MIWPPNKLPTSFTLVSSASSTLTCSFGLLQYHCKLIWEANNNPLASSLLLKLFELILPMNKCRRCKPHFTLSVFSIFLRDTDLALIPVVSIIETKVFQSSFKFNIMFWYFYYFSEDMDYYKRQTHIAPINSQFILAENTEFNRNEMTLSRSKHNQVSWSLISKW